VVANRSTLTTIRHSTDDAADRKPPTASRRPQAADRKALLNLRPRQRAEGVPALLPRIACAGVLIQRVAQSVDH
jgi:hypothetical protein